MKNYSRLVVLPYSGQVVPRAAWRVVANLQRRGLRLSADLDTDVLRVGPRERITNRDREAIARHRPSVMVLVAYEQTAVDARRSA